MELYNVFSSVCNCTLDWHVFVKVPLGSKLFPLLKEARIKLNCIEILYGGAKHDTKFDRKKYAGK